MLCARPCLRVIIIIFFKKSNVSVLVFVVSKALLSVGEGEKAAEPAAKQPPQTEAAGTCGCNKSCNCSKGAVVFSDLYSTGTESMLQTRISYTVGPLIPLIQALDCGDLFCVKMPKKNKLFFYSKCSHFFK